MVWYLFKNMRLSSRTSIRCHYRFLKFIDTEFQFHFTRRFIHRTNVIYTREQTRTRNDMTWHNRHLTMVMTKVILFHSSFLLYSYLEYCWLCLLLIRKSLLVMCWIFFASPVSNLTCVSQWNLSRRISSFVDFCTVLGLVRWYRPVYSADHVR